MFEIVLKPLAIGALDDLSRGVAMRTMTIFDAKNHFSRALRCAARDVVIITRHGKPVAALEGLREEDLEDFLLERSETFWEMIRKARKGKSVPIEAVRRRLKA